MLTKIRPDLEDPWYHGLAVESMSNDDLLRYVNDDPGLVSDSEPGLCQTLFDTAKANQEQVLAEIARRQ